MKRVSRSVSLRADAFMARWTEDSVWKHCSSWYKFCTCWFAPFPSHQVSFCVCSDWTVRFYKENCLYLFVWEQFQRELPGQGALPQISSWDAGSGCWAGICWLVSIFSENQVCTPPPPPPAPRFSGNQGHANNQVPVTHNEYLRCYEMLGLAALGGDELERIE